MPLTATGEIRYHEAPGKGQIQYQTDPPVCNGCTREITQEHVGWMYFESRGRTGGKLSVLSTGDAR